MPEEEGFEDTSEFPPPAPKVNRFYPVTNKLREMYRWSFVVPNRRDRRARRSANA